MDFSRPDNARQINRLRILNILRQEKLSRAELSREILLSKVSISDIVESLLKDGYIVNANIDRMTAGRPATKLEINKNAGRAFAVEIKQSNVSVSISDALGRPLRFERFPRRDEMWQDIISMIDKLSQGNKVLGVCFVLSENIDIPKLPFKYTTTTASIAQAKSEISIANTSLDNFYFVSWSDTIEAVFYNKNLIPIKSFAHMKVTKDAPCMCGSTGCLDAVASGYALKKKTGITNLRDLLETNEIKESAKSMVFAISQAVQATGAKAVMILGELSKLSDDIYASMQTRLSLLLPPDRDDVFIYRSQCGERGSREGAAIIALEKFFYHTDIIDSLSALERESLS